MDGLHHGLGGVRAVEAVDSKDFLFAADPVQPLSMVVSHVMVLGLTSANVIENTVQVKCTCLHVDKQNNQFEKVKCQEKLNGLTTIQTLSLTIVVTASLDNILVE